MNVFLTCTFVDTVIVNYIAYSAGDAPAMLLVKFDSQGQYLWSKRTYGEAVCGKKVSIDKNNNVYVAGTMSGNNSFDTISVSSALHNFIVKYNSAGQIQWLREVGGGSTSAWGLGFKTDAQGNSYLAGTYFTKAYFGTYTVNAYGGTYFEEVYLAKIDANGNWLWATHAGGNDGSNQAGLFSLDVDALSNVYICGFTGYNTTHFGTVTATSTGGDDWFIAKFNPTGNCVWAKVGGGSGTQQATSICVNSNFLYLAITGDFFSKYDTDGNYLTSQNKPGVSNIAVISDDLGNIYFTGVHFGTISFDTFTLNLNPPNTNQMYLALYDLALLTTGKQEQAEQSSIKVYPNPGNHRLIISMTDPLTGKINIANAIGSTVYSESFTEFSRNWNKEINTDKLPTGFYTLEMIEVSTQKKLGALKFIIN